MAENKFGNIYYINIYSKKTKGGGEINK